MPPPADLLSAAATLGTWSLEGFYLPVVLWTLLALAALLLDRYVPVERPLLRRDLLVLLLLALPAGVVGRAMVAPSVPQRMTVALPVPSTFTVEPSTVGGGPPARPAPRPWGAIAAGAGLLLLGTLSAGALSAYSVRLLRLRRLARSCRTPAPPEIQRLSDRLNGEHAGRPVQLRVSVEAAVPMTLGVRRPIIVLPEPLTRDERGVRLALLHELAHVRFGDAALAIAVGFLRALGFPHPAVHALARRADLLGELACDAAVLEAEADARRAYGELLVRYSGPSFPLTASLAARPSTLRYRLLALRGRLLLRRAPLRSVLAGTVAVGLLLATGALQARQHPPSSARSPAVTRANSQATGTPPEHVPAAPPGATVRTQRLPAGAAPTTPPGPSPSSPGAASDTQTEPTPLNVPPVEWPAGALRDSIEGFPALNVYVGADGRVIEARLLQLRLRHAGSGAEIASGSPYEVAIARAVSEAGMRSTFTPAMREGEPVAAWRMLPMKFDIPNGTIEAARATCAVPAGVRAGGPAWEDRGLLNHWAFAPGARRPTTSRATPSDRSWLECLTARLSEDAGSEEVHMYRAFAVATLAQFGHQ
jgi:beta-lactamase regulating signal transducer with metallopeptidase domain